MLAEPPQFHFGRGGFVFASADGKNELKLRAVLNVDGRAYFSDALHDTFVIRRARPFPHRGSSRLLRRRAIGWKIGISCLSGRIGPKAYSRRGGPAKPRR